MGIKIKYIDPKISDFGMEDFIVNAQTGDIFYKANKIIYRLRGDDLSIRLKDVTESRVPAV